MKDKPKIALSFFVSDKMLAKQIKKHNKFEVAFLLTLLIDKK